MKYIYIFFLEFFAVGLNFFWIYDLIQIYQKSSNQKKA